MKGTDLAAVGGYADAQLAATFDDVSLFIDDLQCITYETDDDGDTVVVMTECTHIGPSTGGGANENTGPD